MKRLVVDIDDTITIDNSSINYANKKPNDSLVQKLREYKKAGFIITLFTARNMKTFEGDLEKIKKHTLPIILDWLETHSIPFDEVIIGKPWCGEKGFYIDDKAIRPNEFISKSYEEIAQMLKIN